MGQWKNRQQIRNRNAAGLSLPLFFWGLLQLEYHPFLSAGGSLYSSPCMDKYMSLIFFFLSLCLNLHIKREREFLVSLKITIGVPRSMCLLTYLLFPGFLLDILKSSKRSCDFCVGQVITTLSSQFHEHIVKQAPALNHCGTARYPIAKCRVLAVQSWPVATSREPTMVQGSKQCCHIIMVLNG